MREAQPTSHHLIPTSEVVAMDDSTNRLRYEIINFFLRECRPPTTQELTDKVSGSEYDVVRGLQNLEELHHLKLYDAGVASPSPISMAHPFSHL